MKKIVIKDVCFGGGAHLKRSPAFFIKSIPPRIALFTLKAAPIGPSMPRIGLSRGVTDDDIIKYNIGYCDFGRYQNMVIIPSYDKDGTLNYFTGRSFEQDPFIKYRNPECSRDIIPFELFINWDSPLVLCEGPFDAIAIKRNAIPLLGKNIQSNLLKRIVQSTVKKIYIALDTDAIKQALKHCEYLLNQGKEVYLVELDGKDPSDLGFSYFTKLIQNTEPIDQYDLMEKKISLV